MAIFHWIASSRRSVDTGVSIGFDLCKKRPFERDWPGEILRQASEVASPLGVDLSGARREVAERIHHGEASHYDNSLGS